ncbi:hypothetical protein C8R46DRAFT_1191776 [Mycena filopes]|nr:hypothetical protein C8R46DRAFT_1191776 [Mycena filopes]
MQAPATVYPVLTLPNEITMEIFGHCALFVEHWNNRSRALPLPAVVLPLVCHAWRDIAHSTPEIWSTLRLRFDKIPVQWSEDRVKGFIERWLDRAGKYPLLLVFQVASSLTVKPFLANLMREALQLSSQRLHYLQIDMNEANFLRLATELSAAEFPLLEKATIECNFRLGRHPLPLEIFNRAPHFHHLRLCMDWYNISLSHFTPPWGQLTKFEGPLWDLALFSMAVNLTDLTCSVGLDDSPPAPITHSKLRHLTMRSDDDILRHLTLPPLNSLNISRVAQGGETLSLFLARSSPPDLRFLSVQAGDFAFAASWGTTLETLQVKHPSIEFVSTVFDCGENSRLSALPNLRTLKLDVFRGETVDFPQLTRFLSARSNILRSFHLGLCIDDADLAWLKHSWPSAVTNEFSRLKGAGMDIRIRNVRTGRR